MRLYGFLSRVWRRSSYSIKFLLVAILGTHTMLGTAFMWVAPNTFNTPLGVTLVTVERGCAFTVTIWLIWSLLAPVRATTQFLEEYIRTGKITDLPTHYHDEAGRLMAHTHYVVTELDRTVGELAKASTVDSLTSLPNRRFAAERLAKDAETVQAGERAILAMIDLDDLKIVNDTQGHHAGDECLKSLANTLQGLAGERDWVARWGGDEFLALFWDVDDVTVAKLLDNVRESLAPAGISFSDGLTVLGPSVEASLERADAALYSAKRAGKGRSAITGFLLS